MDFPYCKNCDHFTPREQEGFGTCQIAKTDHPEIKYPNSFAGIGGCVFPAKFKERN